MSIRFPYNHASSEALSFYMRRSPFYLQLIFILLFGASTVSQGSAAGVGFEKSESFRSDADIVTNADWTRSAEGTAKVSSLEAKTGTQSLEIMSSSEDQAAIESFSVPADGIIFVDFMLRPSVDASSTPSGIIDANGAILGFIKNQDEGSVVAVASPSVTDGISNSVDTGFLFPLDEQGKAANWIRVTIREDLTSKKWDLFLDSKLTLVDQLLPSSTWAKNNSGSFAVYSSAAGSSFLDDLSISGINPLFPDADKDGMPDAFEKVFGLSSLLNDRDGDINGDGVSNIQKFLKSALPATGAWASRKLIYVDNSIGNDEQNGEFSYKEAGTQGPKATLNAAIRQADSETIIAIAPSKKPYKLHGLFDPSSSTVNIVLLGDINIED